MESFLAGVVFVALFVLWVVVPTKIRRRKGNGEGTEHK